MSLKITDIKLPEKEVANILLILESNNMPVRVPEGGGRSFNCWGFTAYYCQWEAKAIWMEGKKMEQYLKENTTPISKGEAQAGDIAVFRRGDYLTHTAVLLPGGDIVCHKPGSLALCIDTIAAASIPYGDVTYARVVKKEEKEFDNSAECVKVAT
jgi:hypothetical protein